MNKKIINIIMIFIFIFAFNFKVHADEIANINTTGASIDISAYPTDTLVKNPLLVNSSNSEDDYTLWGWMETPAQKQFVSDTVDGILKNIINDAMTSVQKEKAIHDYIVSHVSYDTTLKNHSAYAALVPPYKTVCQGYSLLACRMFANAGIDVRIEASAVHSWNIVNIDGSWYQLDCTWDDPVPDVAGRVRYDFFNLTDAQLKTKDKTKDHNFDASKFPPCTTTFVTTDSAILSGGFFNGTVDPDAKNITIENNKSSIADTVTVTNVTAGDIINVYDNKKTSAKVKLLGTTTVTSSSSIGVVSIPQLGKNAGSIYISLIDSGKGESNYVGIKYSKEELSSGLKAKNVLIMNNIDGIPDIVTVNNITTGDTIRVYDSSKPTAKLIGSSTCSAVTITSTGAIQVTSSAAIVINGTISFALNTSLPSKSGSVFLTIENIDATKNESAKMGIPYKSDASIAPVASKIITFNDEGDNNDIVRVLGLSPGDEILVYDSKTGTNILGRKVVGASKSAVNVNLTLPTITKGKGTIYVSVIKNGKKESPRTAATYVSQ